MSRSPVLGEAIAPRSGLARGKIRRFTVGLHLSFVKEIK